MKEVEAALTAPVPVLLRRSLSLLGFLLGFGLLTFAGTAHADEDDRSPGLLGGVLGGVVSGVSDLTGPVVSDVSALAAPLVAPVVDVVEPVTAPLLSPVTRPLQPVLEVLEPVTRPLLAPAEPVVTPVVAGIGLDPGALGAGLPGAELPGAGFPGADPVRDEPVTRAPAASEPTRAETSAQPSIDARTAATTTARRWAVEEPTTPEVAAGATWHRAPAGGPRSPGDDLPAVAGATTGTASSGGGAGGSPGQADLPGGPGAEPGDGGPVAQAERWRVPPWCYVFGRHHPS
ncbi:hypothetical protein Q5530_16220 [Saccharothrix sp. BKS2]|uniref:hypothetical protein n=1 Tax=Saccharothrix sp. BKS2 TaxID=3064400 RepID=UPI0039E7E7DE